MVGAAATPPAADASGQSVPPRAHRAAARAATPPAPTTRPAHPLDAHPDRTAMATIRQPTFPTGAAPARRGGVTVRRAAEPSTARSHAVAALPSPRRPRLAVAEALAGTFPPAGKVGSTAAALQSAPLMPAGPRPTAAAPVISRTPDHDTAPPEPAPAAPSPPAGEPHGTVVALPSAQPAVTPGPPRSNGSRRRTPAARAKARYATSRTPAWRNSATGSSNTSAHGCAPSCSSIGSARA